MLGRQTLKSILVDLSRFVSDRVHVGRHGGVAAVSHPKHDVKVGCAELLHRQLPDHHVLVITTNRAVVRMMHDIVNHAETVRPTVDQISEEHHPVAFLKIQSSTQFVHRLEKSVNVADHPNVAACPQICLYFFLQFTVPHGLKLLT